MVTKTQLLITCLDDSINSPQLRKPLSGHLYMRIHAVKDANHASTGRFARGPETFCIIKVEDAFKGRTKATRTDKWTDEVHSIEVDKANEIEVTVYDKSGAYPTPIGMLWIRISDLVEEMRRKKIETELSGSQWVTAEQMDRGGGGTAPGFGSNSGPLGGQSTMGNQPPGGNNRSSMTGVPNEANDPNMIEAWFSLEPVGSIKLSMSFSKFQVFVNAEYQLIKGSKTKQGQAEFRHWLGPQGRSAPTQGRSHGAIRPQICSTAVLQHHALRALWRVLEECGWYAVRRLQIHLSQELFRQSRHQMYQQIERRNGPRGRDS